MQKVRKDHERGDASAMREFIVELKSKEVIDYFKAHDHVEIIRCKDCQFLNRPIPVNGVPFCALIKNLLVLIGSVLMVFQL